ncbi:hypothetical protein LINPERHAP1_LOCUS3259 [Linum perenne]
MSGQIINETVKALYCSSPIVSEARTLYEATSLSATIWSDCQILVNAMNVTKHSWS